MSQLKLYLASLMMIATFTSVAQEQKRDSIHAPGGLDNETMKRANDPMASVKALNLQNYIVSSIYGSDVQQNQLLLRYAQPVGRFLFRGTLPFVTISQPMVAPTFGLGDFNLFAIYTLPAKKGN